MPGEESYVADFSTIAPIRLWLLAWLGRICPHFVPSVRTVGHRYASTQSVAQVISSPARSCYFKSLTKPP